MKRACWCRDCQYLSSGNASINVMVPQADLVIKGQTSHYDCVAESGSFIRRKFCGVCGTPLFSEAIGEPDYIMVRAGALDDRNALKPELTIWTGSAPGWVEFDPSSSICLRQPDAS